MSEFDELVEPPSAEPQEPAVPDELPVRQVDEEEPPERVVRSPPFPDDPISELQEQAIRDWFKYGKSEKRTRAERQAVADRIRGRVKA